MFPSISKIARDVVRLAVAQTLTNKTLTSPAISTPAISNPTVSGTLTAQGLVDISGSGAGQIKFPATQNASSNANTLDDYEEGTWTPNVGGTATYSGQVGVYTKVGRVVTIQCQLAITAIGSGNPGTISTLPFASLGTGALQSGSCSYFASLALNAIYLAPYVQNSSSGVTFALSAAAAASATAAALILGNGSEVNFAVTYYTA